MIRIYGYSDDLVEIEGDEGEEEYPLKKNGTTIRLTSPEGDVLDVKLKFGKESWEINVITTTDRETPAWPMWFSVREGSDEKDPVLNVNCPIGTKFEEA